MTVKVLRSVVGEFRPFTMECNRCEATLEVGSLSDVRVENVRDDDQGRSWTSVTVICPVCGHKSSVPDSKESWLLKLKGIY